MKIVISAEGDDRERDLATLHDWLLADSALGGGRAAVTAAQRAPSGRMGLGPDEIQVILGVATFALELGNSLRSWLKARQGTSRLVIHLDDRQQAARLAEFLGSSADVRTDDGHDGGQDPS